MKKAVVIGGTSGIGEATAALFLARGVDVTVGGRDEKGLAEALKRLGGKANGLRVDASDEGSLRAFFEAIGKFDYLVLALSGRKGAGPFRTLDLTDLADGFDAKLIAQLRALQASLPYLAESVTFIGAVSSRGALAGTTGLAAINGALESAARPLANELAPLRVNVVAPGVVATPWWDSMPKDQKEGFFKHAEETLPVRRVGQPEDLAEAIVMLAQNRFATGSVLDVAGGAQLAR